MEEKVSVIEKVDFRDLGRIRYKAAWDYQQELFDLVIKEKIKKRGNITFGKITNETIRPYLLL